MGCKQKYQHFTGIALKSMAFAISKKIQRDGIPGKHFFEQGLAQTTNFIHRSFENVVISAKGI
jgi:hypothetical protein